MSTKKKFDKKMNKEQTPQQVDGEIKKLVGTKAIDFCIDYHKINNSCGTLHLSNAYLSGFVECYKILTTQREQDIRDAWEAARTFYLNGGWRKGSLDLETYIKQTLKK